MIGEEEDDWVIYYDVSSDEDDKYYPWEELKTNNAPNLKDDEIEYEKYKIS